jgi:hypothetical protein
LCILVTSWCLKKRDRDFRFCILVTR